MPAARSPILLIGAGGQLGLAIGVELAPRLPILALTRTDLDMEDLGAVRQAVRRIEPGIIVNCAAYTAVDRAETDRDRCFVVNADAPVVLAEEAERSGALLIHYSSDYVFDGQSTRPYRENDSVRPLNVYGESKAAADRGIPDACTRYLILRSSWIFSATGSNFVTTMLRLARQRREVRVVDDQVGSPTSARFVAAVTSRFVDLHLQDPAGSPTGLFHVASKGSASWFDFARAILAYESADASRGVPEVRAVSSEEFGAPARRPAYSVLDSDRLELALRISVPEWEAELAAVVREIIARSAS